jgi:hypothetical protein
MELTAGPTARATREDGGQLTPEHQASLQQRLDDLNREYLPMKPRGTRAASSAD